MEASTGKSPKSNADSANQKQNPILVEVNNIEKQLWTLIHSKGILHPHVSELYTEAVSTYEQIFKSNLKQEEVQEVEFCLWKLHYKHIDEFRKAVKTDDPVYGFSVDPGPFLRYLREKEWLNENGERLRESSLAYMNS